MKRYVQAAPNLTAKVRLALYQATAPLSSRRICDIAGFAAEQAANVSSKLSVMMKQGAVKVEFGSDPDYPQTDRLYTADKAVLLKYM